MSGHEAANDETGGLWWTAFLAFGAGYAVAQILHVASIALYRLFGGELYQSAAGRGVEVLLSPPGIPAAVVVVSAVRLAKPPSWAWAAGQIVAGTALDASIAVSLSLDRLPVMLGASLFTPLYAASPVVAIIGWGGAIAWLTPRSWAVTRRLLTSLMAGAGLYPAQLVALATWSDPVFAAGSALPLAATIFGCCAVAAGFTRSGR